MNTLKHKTITTIPLLKDHMEPIRQWRNAQLNVLRQTEPLTAEQQEHYFNTVISREQRREHPKLILYTIFDHDTPIGYGGFTHISWPNTRAEISFLTSPEIAANLHDYHHVMDFFLDFLKKEAKILGFTRLHTETYANRSKHLSILESNGFIQEGILRNHVIINGVPTNSILHAYLLT